MPTLEDNWSLVVPEAMAGGKAVLCSVYNGCWPELVREGENGWLFDPRDPDSTARALLGRVGCARSSFAAMGRRRGGSPRDYTPRRAAEAILRACEIAWTTGRVVPGEVPRHPQRLRHPERRGSHRRQRTASCWAITATAWCSSSAGAARTSRTDVSAQDPGLLAAGIYQPRRSREDSRTRPAGAAGHRLRPEPLSRSSRRRSCPCSGRKACRWSCASPTSGSSVRTASS